MAALLAELQAQIAAAGATVKIVAPKIGGVLDSEGVLHPAQEMLRGGKSVLFDAVAILTGPQDAARLAAHPAAQDFLRDAHAHCKFIAHAGADLLIEACGLAPLVDQGYHDLSASGSVAEFLEALRDLRHWDRELTQPH